MVLVWLGLVLAKIALQAGGKIYANRQKAKVAMSDAQLYARKKWQMVRKLTRENFSSSIGLEGRIRFVIIVGADNGVSLAVDE